MTLSCSLQFHFFLAKTMLKLLFRELLYEIKFTNYNCLRISQLLKLDFLPRNQRTAEFFCILSQAPVQPIQYWFQKQSIDAIYGIYRRQNIAI